MSDHTQLLWQQYHQDPNDHHRNQLVERYLPIVQFHAARFHTKTRQHVEVDELTSMGVFGLMDAIKRFDESRGLKFGTFAGHRVVGAIRDGLRGIDHLSKAARAGVRQVEKVVEQTLQSESRRATVEEILDQIGERPPWAKVLTQLADAGCDKSRFVERIDRQPAPGAAIEFNDLFQFITREMSRSERMLLKLVAVEGMTVAQAGNASGHSPAHVSVVVRSVKQRAKARLRGAA